MGEVIITILARDGDSDEYIAATTRSIGKEGATARELLFEGELAEMEMVGALRWMRETHKRHGFSHDRITESLSNLVVKTCPPMVGASGAGLVDVKTMAERLGVPAKWLRERCEDGEVPHLRVSKTKFLFAAEAVEAALVRLAS